ncbi:hypothetical protein OAK91_00145 [Planctomycetaceae bacterium]|nr:hypothetical protein [bacterium]MDC0273124.1 hypothetical protein [Planctomycetaceae bacterium]
MYFRFLIAVAFVVLISMSGLSIDKHNRILQTDMTSTRADQEELTHQIAETRQETLLLGVSKQKLNALEEGHIALPSPDNPSQIVQNKDRSLN